MARAFESQVFGAHRPQTLTGDMILHGIGIMRPEFPDLDKWVKERCGRAIERAYVAGQFEQGSPMHNLAAAVYQALVHSPERICDALSTHIRVDGETLEWLELTAKVRALATEVPSVTDLVLWMEGV